MYLYFWWLKSRYWFNSRIIQWRVAIFHLNNGNQWLISCLYSRFYWAYREELVVPAVEKSILSPILPILYLWWWISTQVCNHYASNICINCIDKTNLIMNYVDLRKNKEYITIIIVNVLYSFQISIIYKLE